MALIAACSAGDDLVSTDRVVEPVADPDGADSAEAEPIEVTSSVETAATAPPQSAVMVEPSADVGPGVFVEDGASELAVSVLLAESEVGDGQARSVGVAVEFANQDIAFPGSPFEANRWISAPVVFGGDVDLRGDLDGLRGEIDGLLAPGVDLFIGAVPDELVAETTELAAARGVPLVLVNQLSSGADVQSDTGVRLDLSGSIDLELRAVADAVVRGEHDGIVVVGGIDEPETLLMRELLLTAGADPVVIDATAAPAPDVIAASSEQIGLVGERPAVVLVSRSWAALIVDALTAQGSQAQFFASDLSLTRSDVDALAGFESNQLVMVRRADDLARPEAAEFASRLAADQEVDAGTAFAALSYDAYALAAIAAAWSGSVDRSTISAGMIEASRAGQPCERLSDCVDLAANGVDVDYQGVSGPLDLDDDGVATAGWFSIDIVDANTRGVASSELLLQRR